MYTKDTIGLTCLLVEGLARPSRCRCRCVWMLGGCRGQAEPVLKAPPSQAPQERPIPAYELMQAWHGNRDAVLISFPVISFD
jgi:hypothetical protein